MVTVEEEKETTSDCSADVTRSLGGMTRRLKRISEDCDEMLDLVDKVKRGIGHIGQAPRPRRRKPRSTKSGGQPPPTQNFQLDPIRRLASFDGDKRVVLTPRLSGLISILAADEGETTGDEIVGFKSVDRITQFMKKHGSSDFKRTSVPQLLTRLRDALDKAGIDVGLIESSRQRGVRLRRIKPHASGLRGG